MIYTEEDYYDDLHSGKMLHLKSKERFSAFYERLGMDDIQKQQQVVNSRLDVLEKVKGSVIELGCHIGFQSIYLAELGHEVTGVDISSSLIKEANIRKNKLPGEISNKLIFIKSDILDLPYLGKFDTILLTEVLEHVIDPFEIIKKSIEFMHSESILLISAPKKRNGTFSHVRGITEEFLTDTGNRLDIYFEFFSTTKETKAIGML